MLPSSSFSRRATKRRQRNADGAEDAAQRPSLRDYVDGMLSLSDESSEEEESEDEPFDPKADGKAVQRRPRCRMLDDAVLHSKVSMVNTIARAHLHLDQLLDGEGTSGMWVGIHTILKEDGRRSSLLDQLRRQCKREEEVFNEAAFVRLADRLQARLDDIFSARDKRSATTTQVQSPHSFAMPDPRSRAYTALLSSPDHKALNASLQLWRKSFRGAAGAYAGPIHSRWSTSYDISHLYRQGARSSFVYCPAVGSSWSEPIDSVECAENVSWKILQVCGPSIVHRRHALEALAPKLKRIEMVFEYKHQTNPTSECVVVDILKSLPPIMYTSNLDLAWQASLERLHEGQVSIDSRRVCRSLHKDEVRTERAIRANLGARSTLLSMAAFVVQQHSGQDETHGQLPDHLRNLVRHVYRCVSCKRLVGPPTATSSTQTSTCFEHAASKAGFDLSEVRTKMLVASLKAQSAFCPPFHEPIADFESNRSNHNMLRHLWGSLRKSETLQRDIMIGGYYMSQEDDPRFGTPRAEDRFGWRFCIPCFASHVGLRGYEDKSLPECRCSVCVFERDAERRKLRVLYARYKESI